MCVAPETGFIPFQVASTCGKTHGGGLKAASLKAASKVQSAPVESHRLRAIGGHPAILRRFRRSTLAPGFFCKQMKPVSFSSNRVL